MTGWAFRELRRALAIAIVALGTLQAYRRPGIIHVRSWTWALDAREGAEVITSNDGKNV